MNVLALAVVLAALANIFCPFKARIEEHIKKDKSIPHALTK